MTPGMIRTAERNGRRALLDGPSRRWLLLLSAGLWGLGIAIGSLPFWLGTAAVHQLPALMTQLGRNAHAPFRFFFALLVIPILTVLLSGKLAAPLVDADARGWSRVMASLGMAGALWTALLGDTLPWIVLPPALALASAVALRRHELRFSRRDWLLIPATLSLLFALADIAPGQTLDRYALIATAIVLIERGALAIIRPRQIMEPALDFAIAPLALVAQIQLLGYHQRHFGWLPLLVVIGTPLILRAAVPDSLRSRRRLLVAVALVVYPLVTYTFPMLATLSSAEGRPRVNFFENGQGLLPASELLRGKLPYRDIIPPHGLIEDSLLDWFSLTLHGATVGAALQGRGLVGGLKSVGIYALTAAATGSPEAGIASFFLASLLGISGLGFTRVVPAIFALALLASAIRSRSMVRFGAASMMAVVSFLNSLDFGLYTLATIVVAIGWYTRQSRAEGKRAVVAAVIGIALIAVPAMLILASFGIAGVALRTTFLEILPLGSVYAVDVYDAAPPALRALRFFPDVLSAVFDRSSFLFLIWLTVLVMTAVAIGARVRLGRRYAPLAMVAVWMVFAGLSIAERHHLYFQYAVPPLLIGATFLILRGRRRSQRVAGAGAVIALMLLAPVTPALEAMLMLRRARGPVSPGWIAILGMPRARGGMFRPEDAAIIEAARSYADQHLGPDQTFFDFTNRGMLYFLLDRSCPIRQGEVPFYETEAAQSEVIARLEGDRSVAAALVPRTMGDATIDGIPNASRAPRVWHYLEEHFTPDFAQGDVVFWRRKESN
jgi:hypothetical protein